MNNPQSLSKIPVQCSAVLVVLWLWKDLKNFKTLVIIGNRLLCWFRKRLMKQRPFDEAWPRVPRMWINCWTFHCSVRRDEMGTRCHRQSECVTTCEVMLITVLMIMMIWSRYLAGWWWLIPETLPSIASDPQRCSYHLKHQTRRDAAHRRF